MSSKVQKIMVQPINLIFRYLQNKSRVQIWLFDKTDLRIEGQIIGFDEFMNLVLENSEEVDVKNNTRVKVGNVTGITSRVACCVNVITLIIGRVLLKGDNITLIQGVDN